jgi:hypothetical protein
MPNDCVHRRMTSDPERWSTWWSSVLPQHRERYARLRGRVAFRLWDRRPRALDGPGGRARWHRSRRGEPATASWPQDRPVSRPRRRCRSAPLRISQRSGLEPSPLRGCGGCGPRRCGGDWTGGQRVPARTRRYGHGFGWPVVGPVWQGTPSRRHGGQGDRVLVGSRRRPRRGRPAGRWARRRNR